MHASVTSMLRPRRLAGFALLASLTASAVSLAGGPQFVDETSSRFPGSITEYTNQLTIGDIDNDGDLDIIWASGGGFGGSSGTKYWARIFINDGNGFFTDETVDRGTDLLGNYRGAELGDIERDGDLDLLLVQDYGQRPRLLINDGNGFFSVASGQQFAPPILSSSRGQFGDVDNDGDLDIYMTNGGSVNRFGCGQYQLMLNDGDGFFTNATATNLPQQNDCENMDCIFADIDGDYDLDIRTASTGFNNSRLFVNDGTGVFAQSNNIPNDSTCYSYDFGDINGDGDLDLVGVNAGSGSSELLLTNNGAGVFSNISSQISPNPSQDDNDSKFFDYDNDGDLDLIIGRLGGTSEKIYNNDGNGSFTLTSGLITSNFDSTLDIMVADMDNDGDYDVITAQGESGFWLNRIYINNGPADTNPPDVIDTEQIQSLQGGADEYVVRAEILDDMTSDRNFFDKGITLHWSNDPDFKTEQTAPMLHSGGQVYRGVIPGDVSGTVYYFVSAIDWNNNEGSGDVLSFDAGSIPGDINEDGFVDVDDLLALLGVWGPCVDCPEDIDNSGEVDVSDLLTLLGNWT